MREPTGGFGDWREEFVLVREISEIGARGRHYREVASGLLVPVARGVYRRADAAAPSDHDRYLAQVRGVHLAARRSAVFSHYSAALLWRLPIFERWPGEVHVLSDARGGGRSAPGLVRHRDAPGRLVTRADLTLTSLVRTVADVSSLSSLRTAVVIVDAALAGLRAADGRWLRHPLDREELEEELGRRAGARGIRQLRWAAGFGSAAAGSPGESVSRLTMHQIGCPPPELQHPFFDPLGRIGVVDFWWPQFELIGEFDGRGKYLRDEFTAGRDPGQVVIEEKIREDRLRATGPGMVRWVWEEAVSPRLLRAKLARAGLPCRR